MTKVLTLARLGRRQAALPAWALRALLLLTLLPGGQLPAQKHWMHGSGPAHGGPIGSGPIGPWQPEPGPVSGFFQPVEIRAPQGTMISMAVAGGFEDPDPAPLRVGLLLGPTYRLRVTDIPLREGEEVFPTVQVIDRLYPPPGLIERFPIPIELTREELDMALEGKFVTRVIYVEDPDYILPAVQGENIQPWIDVGPGVNPVHAANELGRPVAILRLGGRLPGAEGPDPAFLHGSPAFVPLAPPPRNVVPDREPVTEKDRRAREHVLISGSNAQAGRRLR